MPIQFENKKMFFGQVGGGGDTGRSSFHELESSKGPTPNTYYTTAPASLPCAPPPPCKHRDVDIKRRIPAEGTVIVYYHNCRDSLKMSEVEYRTKPGRL